MKSPACQERFYRSWGNTRGLHAAVIRERETDLHILTDKPLDTGYCAAFVKRARGQVEDYINRKDPRFLSSLKPIPVELTAPPIVRRMAAAAAKAGVGPMAGVAGAIAQALGTALARKGYGEVIIENGGDIFLKAARPVTMGVYAGDSPFSRRVRLGFEPAGHPFGVCTSSGTVGHSLSFGNADSVTVVARDAALADACATAVANRVSSKNDIPAAVAFGRSIAGVRGILVIFRDTLASWGSVRLA